MKRKMLAIGLGLILSLSVCSCGSGSEKTYTQSEVDEMLKEAKGDAVSESSSETDSESENENSEDYDSVNEDTKETESKDNKDSGSSSPVMFSEHATIDETILVDESDVKITATALNYLYNDTSVEIALQIENNSDKSLSFYEGTLGYSVSSVNGYMTDSFYLNADVEPGKKANETVTIQADELMLYGIRDLAEIQLAFEVEDEDYNDYLITGPCLIRTSIADSYEYGTESFSATLKDTSVLSQLNSELVFESEEQIYDENGIKLLSESLIKNYDGDEVLFLEFENTGSDEVDIQSSNISVNGVVLSSGGYWDSMIILPGKKGIMSLNMNNMKEKEFLEMAGISETKTISVDITQRDVDYNIISDEKTIEIPVKGTDAGYTPAGDEIVNENGVIIYSLGKLDDPDEYSESIHLLFLIYNTTGKEIYADLDYSGNSLNGFMTDLSCYGVSLNDGQYGIIDVELQEYNKEDVSVSTADDITTAELAFKVETEDYDTILEKNVTVTY